MFSRNDKLETPGEYGKIENPSGWVLLQVPELKNQKIYLSSKDYAAKLANYYKIPPKNIVSLIAPAPLSKLGIPEEILAGKNGLAMFQERLQKIEKSNTPILIHCKQGLNRTPVAVVLYLINRHIAADRAVEIVTDAYRRQRDENFVLDKRGHYYQVLAEAGVNHPAPLSKRRRLQMESPSWRS